MPKLQCKVKQCIYNSTGLCSKNYIDIEGPEASNKKETSCKSYIYNDIENLNYEFASFDKSPSLQTEVYCDAIQCVYEKGQRCYADKIEIANIDATLNSNPKTIKNSVTHCKTFEPKD